MTAPNLMNADFPNLSQSHSSSGTVTGTNIDVGDAIRIDGHNHRRWRGQVDSSAGGNLWNATVTRTAGALKKKHKRKHRRHSGFHTASLEEVSVTVTNTDGTSAPVQTPSDVIP